jgi:hypothetical protein
MLSFRHPDFGIKPSHSRVETQSSSASFMGSVWDQRSVSYITQHHRTSRPVYGTKKSTPRAMHPPRHCTRLPDKKASQNHWLEGFFSNINTPSLALEVPETTRSYRFPRQIKSNQQGGHQRAAVILSLMGRFNGVRRLGNPVSNCTSGFFFFLVYGPVASVQRVLPADILSQRLIDIASVSSEGAFSELKHVLVIVPKPCCPASGWSVTGR